MKRNYLAITLLGAGLALSACGTISEPTVQNHGFVERGPDRFASVKAGVTTKPELLEQVGSPSTVSSFGDEIWYYISSTSEQATWRKEKITARNVVAIRFNRANVVTKIDRYTKEDGEDIALVDRKTETRGRKLGFLEQLLGNVGRFGDGESALNVPGGAP